MSDLPEPLTPADCDLRGMPFMPFRVRALSDDPTWFLTTGNEFRARLLLWGEAWNQIPASSLPNDQRLLAHMSRAGHRWRSVRRAALDGFVLCSDGRLYHPEIAERARSAWTSRLALLGRVNRRLEMISGEWAAIRSAIFARDDFTCRYCGARGGRLECDHVIPVSKGGASTPDNLVTACFDCNRSKGAKRLHQWGSCRG
jgi:hypothetical protein